MKKLTKSKSDQYRRLGGAHKQADNRKVLRLSKLVGQVAQQCDPYNNHASPRTLCADGDNKAQQVIQHADLSLTAHDPDASSAASPNANVAHDGERTVGATRLQQPDPRLVRRIIRHRQLRARFFEDDLFADPAWDMLLELTAARAERARISVTSLCIASGVPATTALRWISLLIKSGLVERFDDKDDRRRTFVVITDKAAQAMARYFAVLDTPASHLG